MELRTMKILKFFLIALILSFSGSGIGAEKSLQPKKTINSLYSQLLNLENDLKEGKPRSVILSEVKTIEEAKKNLPVSYIPELNFLIKSGVERVPSTEITLLKNLIYYIYPIQTAVKTFMFLMLFYTFILYFQNIDASPLTKRISTLIGVVLLVVSFVSGSFPFIYGVSGIGLLLLTTLSKKKFGIYLGLAILFLLVLQTAGENARIRLKSESFLYKIKVKRDGYAPYYLIDSVFRDEKIASIEKITSDLSLGKFNSVAKLSNLKVKSPLIQSIIFNDYGYVEFMKGHYKKALSFFKKALKLKNIREYKYNLYLTYSSLLKLEMANHFKNELIKEGISLEKLPPVPLIVHIPSELPRFFLPTFSIIGLILGLFSGEFVVRFFKATVGNLEQELLLIPGMRRFINSEIKYIIFITFLILVINLLLGKIICKG